MSTRLADCPISLDILSKTKDVEIPKRWDTKNDPAWFITERVSKETLTVEKMEGQAEKIQYLAKMQARSDNNKYEFWYELSRLRLFAQKCDWTW